ncbi:LuxR family transcriptional regulator [Streptomyces sp. 8ZJF_21]|uniref:helix-turn-helix transcriptional regulator n=1 Tax=Streptomyces sp. 8ZJF_21 TaxID=2903141 RepID=UPI001E473A76|nr:LuxR family transcriptional regulator [Streptomyces sp. 8ZJF_21]MCD9591918.1 AAA family ATPase [Streptomyces sp. 8ZJF_21]
MYSGTCREGYELVAREDELGILQRSLEQASSGQGVVVTVTGPIACGKTELLDAAAAKAEAIILRAVCAPEERAMPYAMIGQLIDDPALAHRAPGLADRIAQGGQLSLRAENRLRRDLTRALLALAVDRPVLIGVDDVHHADTASLNCLLHLARRVRPARISMIFTELRSLTPTQSRFKAELLSLPYHHEIALRPFGPEQSAELARAAFGPGLAEDVLAGLYKTTRGNLSLSRGLISDVREALANGESAFEAGRAFRLAYLGSLYRCGPVALRVARVAAVLGPSATTTLVRRLSGLSAETIDRATKILTEGGLLLDQQFPHPAARSVVLDDMSAQERRGLHTLALELLDEAPVEVLAHHQVGAGLIHGPKAAEMFAKAGKALVVRNELGDAAEYLQLAHRASDDVSTRAALRVEAVAIERRRNPLASSRHMDELSAAGRAGLLSPKHAALAVFWLADGGRSGEAAEVLASERPLATTDQNRAHLRFVEVTLALFSPGAFGSDRRPPPLTPDELASLPKAAWQCAVADNAAMTALHGHPELATAQAETVLRQADSAADAIPTALIALLYAENTESAHIWADKLGSTNAGVSNEAEAGYAGPCAEIALRRGDLATAFEAGSAVLDDRSLPSLGITAALLLSSKTVAAVRLGELERAEKLLAEPLPNGVQDSLFGLHLLSAYGQYSLAMGRYESALRAFHTCGERMRSWDVDVPGLALWRVDAAEALLSLDRNEGQRLIDEQLTRPMGPRSRALTLRIKAAYLPRTKRIPLLHEAAELLLPCPDPYEQARVLADLGDTLSALRRYSRARGVLRQARHLATQCGAVPLLRRLGGEPGRIDDAGLPQRSTSLTDAERRVAALAAAGQTNREIAEQLFVTASTVEQHLTSVFRKLGVKGRKQLPTALADVEQT